MRDGGGAGVRPRDGRQFTAEHAVSNADAAAASRRPYSRPKGAGAGPTIGSTRTRVSMSSFLLYLGLDRRYDKLGHYTILIGFR